jgi:hypothetical protein
MAMGTRSRMVTGKRKGLAWVMEMPMARATRGWDLDLGLLRAPLDLGLG